MIAPAHVDNRRQGLLDDLRGAKAEDFDHIVPGTPARQSVLQ